MKKFIATKIFSGVILVAAALMLVSTIMIPQIYGKDQKPDIETKDVVVTEGNQNNSEKPKKLINIAAWLNKADGRYVEGDEALLFYQVNRDSYVSIFLFEPSGEVVRLFPKEKEQLNFSEGGRVYDFKLPLKEGSHIKEGSHRIKVVATIDPSNTWQSGVSYKSDNVIHTGTMVVIPMSSPVMFADQYGSRFFYTS
ncbi:exported hypothetical protein [Desulfamplus magnetovallimortis]|uniref:DUF4384 domain-containing protein n=1 Tax=Desulfamplus magnetovallimortis TaxID=1246637 RepID=A0A1W1H4S4_9BACT|nr:DUF4384 domain-containing protein [Desulfamplus magnetovallimortis]SLM27483.1 exported hypothetical protein [Desulfamplus magnetovallimortis]